VTRGRGLRGARSPTTLTAVGRLGAGGANAGVRRSRRRSVEPPRGAFAGRRRPTARRLFVTTRYNPDATHQTDLDGTSLALNVTSFSCTRSVTPETEVTHRRGHFALMKPVAVYINTALRAAARHRCVGERAAITGTSPGRRARHFIGVEPPTDHPLCAMSHVVLLLRYRGRERTTPSQPLEVDRRRRCFGSLPERIARQLFIRRCPPLDGARPFWKDREITQSALWVPRRKPALVIWCTYPVTAGNFSARLPGRNVVAPPLASRAYYTMNAHDLRPCAISTPRARRDSPPTTE